MPNTLDAQGLQVKTVTEVSDGIKTALRDIYGQDINLESNSPDGQMVGIFSQAVADMLEVLAAAYNSMSLEQAFGVMLDQRVALNGITRLGGTYSDVLVDVDVDRALVLNGQDARLTDPNVQVYTVIDEAGGLWELSETKTFSGAGTDSLTFVSKTPGAVTVAPYSIQRQGTVTLGVTSVSNPAATNHIGEDEEGDVALKVRHAKMFYLPGVGPADAVRAAVLAALYVVDAYVVENNTGGTVNGVPAHGILVVARSSDEANSVGGIAEAIYQKKTMGCALTGDVAHDINSFFTARWYWAVAQPLHIRFGMTARVANATKDDDAIKADIISALQYKLGDVATIGDVVQAMLTIAPKYYLTAVGVSDDGATWGDSVSPSAYQNYFTITAANITIT